MFLYDGMKCTAALKPDQTLFQAYVWGLDLSGTVGGAGGVGGLAMFRRVAGASTETYFPTYDGNGNVTGLVKGEDAGVANSAGTVVARYDYGPFGQLLRISGEPVALDNQFRFSTKWQDDQTDLLYYGFRYYAPSTGRWLNRDPLGELGHELLKENSGGDAFASDFGFDEGEGDERQIPESTFMNLYAFVGNNPVYRVDPNGEVIWVPVVVGCRIAVIGNRAYQSLKKARKARAAVCDTIWAGYKAACAVGCHGSNCEQVSKGYAATLLCAEGRVLYLKLRCDDVGGGYGYKGKLDPQRKAKRKAHEGKLVRAKQDVETCRAKKERACALACVNPSDDHSCNL